MSTQYRYIGIAFGIGRYQPHAAEDVLANNYGDCKDKQTLLAALLQTSGITLYPALVNSSWKVDPDVPSPAQFDHVIGYLPQNKDKNKDAIWLDTTPEVAPFGYILPPLRDKPALVMAGEKSIQLVTTPADPPFPSTQAFKIEGTLSNDGTFEAKVEDTIRGDTEVPIRAAFRLVAQPQWKDLMQQISYGLGYAGTVNDVSASAPEAISQPFHFSYSYNRKDFPDWTNRQFTVPGLPFYMPPVRDDGKHPIWFGAPTDTVADSKVELPQGYKPQLPSNVDLKYDFAEYHASYSQDQGVLIAKRRLLTKVREVPVAELDDYRNFIKNMQNDINQYVQTVSTSAPVIPNAPLTAMGPLPGAPPSLLSEAMKLPASNSSEANQLEADAFNAARHGDHPAALRSFRRAVEEDPKFTRAWLELSSLYMLSGQSDSSLDAVRKAIASDPELLLAREAYASLLAALRRTDEAIDAAHDALKISPNDPEANRGLGVLLLGEKRYSEAVPYLEAAAKNDNSQDAQSRLGYACLRSGQIERGTSILQKIADGDPKPMILNNIAYNFAEANTNLPKALEYAQRAIDEEEKESHKVELSNILSDDLACTQSIGYLWDTVGWIHFRLGHLDQAESYIRAAWLLQQQGLVADHLGQIYEQQKKTEKAIHMYRLALATPEAHTSDASWDETRHRLEHLTGKKASTAPEMLRWDSSADELASFAA